jgi:amino acid transporter
MWIGLVSLLASVSTANTLLGSVPNIVSGMAKHDMFPRVFSVKNKYNVPVVVMGLLVLVVVFQTATGFALYAGLVNILLAASCFWLTAYILVSLAVLVLRFRYPNHPGRNKKLALFGIPQLLSIAGNVYMIRHISDDPASRMMIYKIFFVLLGILAAYALVWIGLVKKQLFAGTKIEDIMEEIEGGGIEKAA